MTGIITPFREGGALTIKEKKGRGETLNKKCQFILVFYGIR